MKKAVPLRLAVVSKINGKSYDQENKYFVLNRKPETEAPTGFTVSRRY